MVWIYVIVSFGYGDNWAGRVSFSDAHVQGTLKMCPSDYPHPLMGPNPTSFQLYLEQNVDDHNTYNHWGHEHASLRGYKNVLASTACKSEGLDAYSRRKKKSKAHAKSVLWIEGLLSPVASILNVLVM